MNKDINKYISVLYLNSIDAYKSIIYYKYRRYTVHRVFNYVDNSYIRAYIREYNYFLKGIDRVYEYK